MLFNLYVYNLDLLDQIQNIYTYDFLQYLLHMT
jgi:hypothetical protein